MLSVSYHPPMALGSLGRSEVCPWGGTCKALLLLPGARPSSRLRRTAGDLVAGYEYFRASVQYSIKIVLKKSIEILLKIIQNPPPPCGLGWVANALKVN